MSKDKHPSDQVSTQLPAKKTPGTHVIHAAHICNMRRMIRSVEILAIPAVLLVMVRSALAICSTQNGLPADAGAIGSHPRSRSLGIRTRHNPAGPQWSADMLLERSLARC